MEKKELNINKVLTKGVEQVLPNKDDLVALMQKRKIRLYNGIDPTSKRLHLGHSIPLRKLNEFAGLGHEVIMVIGTGTVLAGDPSLRESARPKITAKEIKENIKTWRQQAGKILDFSKVQIKYNGDWLLTLKLKEILDIASHVSAVKLFQREMFQRRLKRGDTVWMHETLYPLLQGYDSVALNVDLEIGGTDQVFNMLIGRELLQKIKGKEKFVMTLPMILGTDGKPMSKTSGNCIWLDDSADQMFGRIMSMPDDLVISYFENLTDLPSQEIMQIRKELGAGTLNPVFPKRRLGLEIVKMYHGREAAVKAEKEFNRIFKQKETPSLIPQFKTEQETIKILDLLIRTKLAPSKAEAKRLIEQGGVKIDGIVQGDWKKNIEVKKGMIVQVGKRRFVKII